MQWTARCTAPSVLIATLILALLSPATDAQDLTAADLLQQGQQQLQNGQYAEARQTLQRIDPVQLDGDQQQALEQARQSVTAALGAQQTLNQAQAARGQGNIDQALALYREVAEDGDVPQALRDQASAAVTELSEAQPPDGPATEVRAADEVEDDVPEAPAASPDDQIMQQARMLVAQERVIKARRALNENQPNRAISLFKQALELDPDNVAAKEGLARAETAQAQMRTDLGDWPGNLPEVLNIERQRAMAIHRRRMTEAREARDAGNYEKARQAALLARSVIDDNANLFEEARRTELRQEATALAQEISQLAEAQQLEQMEQQQEAAEQRAADAREAAEQETQDKIHRLLQNATELSRQQRYDRALEQLEQVLFIEPNNVSAKFMRDFIQEVKVQEQWFELRRERSRKIAQHRVANMEQTIPYNDLITYPPDWPQLTRMRLGQQDQGVDSEANRLAREKLRQAIPVDFSGNDLASVIEYFRRVTGAEIVPQWRTLEDAGVTRDTPITIRLRNVPAEKALELILNEAGGELVTLDYAIDEGVVIIATTEFLAQKTELRTYDIKDLVVQIPSFDDAPEFDLSETLSGDTDDGGGGDIFTDTEGGGEDTLPQSERIARVMELIRNSVAPDSWQQLGGLTSSMEELNGTLIVRTTAESHREIQNLLAMLREQRALQIAVESRFLFVTQNFLEAVGMDMDITVQAGDRDWLSNDISIQQNTIESASPPSTTVSGSLGGEDFVPSLAFGAATDAGVGSLGFIVDDLRVDVLVRATQQNVRNIIVNTPRVTFFNGQRAYVNVARQVAFISDLEPTVGDSSSALSPTISTISDGVVLDVEGTISADRRYVTLTVRPSLSQIIALRRFTDVAGGGDGDGDGDGDGGDGGDDGDDDDGGVVGGIGDFLFGSGGSGSDGGSSSGGSSNTGLSDSVQAFGFIQVPEISLTSVRTSVSVPDKGTLLLGGQRLVGEVEVQSGVPILSKIPVINRLFTNRSKVRDERTLLILIKPTIIVQSEQEERLFPGMMQSPELYNLGTER